ncbi:kinase-like domain-containing protein [Mycena maculata]|uniref:Kinase-like domain-containing protein n=1 Tax=Mycena maculata TaxID=230809 RepID=A0AAD7P0C8_9AGAR|nr:kinase-like domain-containing protein [Mycena maculata]
MPTELDLRSARLDRLLGINSNQDRDFGGLSESETFWRDHQPWLEECGYMLRPRYRPGWVRSWEGTNKDPWHCTDGPPGRFLLVLDAVRIRDKTDVCLKRIDTGKHKLECEIGTFFSSGSLADDPENHCVPILETLQFPDDEKITILVMPLLRKYSDPRFDTFGEAVDFFGQIFEGLKFMHDHNVAHRDCNSNNIMMDGSKMFPEGYHPVKPKLKRDYYSGRARFYTRTQRPPKYYLIDFGLSSRYQTRNPPPLEMGIEAGDKSVPEFQLSENSPPPKPSDPFPIDVYYLGNMIRQNFLEGRPIFSYQNRLYGFEFMKPLVDDMTSNDPSKRPTADEVVERFAIIRDSLSSWKLRSRVIKASDSLFPGALRSVKHWYRRIRFILLRVPTIPVKRA